jgi:hypothetical protein
MKNSILIPVILAVLTGGLALFIISSPKKRTVDTAPAKQLNPTDSSSLPLPFANAAEWRQSFDLDGDSINEVLDFNYSNGAHCCYTLNFILSHDRKAYHFPFEMDGGYLTGVDSTQPWQFAVRDIDADGLPEIMMQIATYNAAPYPLPLAWRKKYGIHSHTIIIEYEAGKVKVRDNSDPIKMR